MEFKETAQQIIEAHQHAIIYNKPRDLEGWIIAALKEAYKQGRQDYKKSVAKRKEKS